MIHSLPIETSSSEIEDSPQSFKAGTSCQGHGKPPIYGNTQLAGIRCDRTRLHTHDEECIFLTIDSGATQSLSYTLLISDITLALSISAIREDALGP